MRQSAHAIKVHPCLFYTDSKGLAMSDERVRSEMPVIGRIDLREVEKPEAIPSERFAESIAIGLTFDDVLLRPAKSEMHPNFVDVSTRLTRDIRLNIPIISAAMDTVTERMTKESLIPVPVGTTLEQAREVLHHHRIEKLLVVDSNGDLKGLITVKDIQKARRYPQAAKDPLGRLRCGAAIGVGKEGLDRARALIDAKVDVVVIDSAHAHSAGVMDVIRQFKKLFPDTPLIPANSPPSTTPPHPLT